MSHSEFKVEQSSIEPLTPAAEQEAVGGSSSLCSATQQSCGTWSASECGDCGSSKRSLWDRIMDLFD